MYDILDTDPHTSEFQPLSYLFQVELCALYLFQKEYSEKYSSLPIKMQKIAKKP